MRNNIETAFEVDSFGPYINWFTIWKVSQMSNLKMHAIYQIFHPLICKEQSVCHTQYGVFFKGFVSDKNKSVQFVKDTYQSLHWKVIQLDNKKMKT